MAGLASSRYRRLMRCSLGSIALWALAACAPPPKPGGDGAPGGLDSGAGVGPDADAEDRLAAAAGPLVGCDLDALDKTAALEAIIDGEGSVCEVRWYISVLDEIEDTQHEGPWLEQLWMMPSADGLSFDVATSTPIRTMAAVPEAVIGPDGRTYLFYTEGDLEHGRRVARSGSRWFQAHGLIGYGAISAMVSDDGVGFTLLDDFQIGGVVRGMVADPDVIQLPDGRWRMYYVGLSAQELGPSGVLDEVVPSKAFYAESDDLIHWTQIGVAAEGPDADPTVVCDADGGCRMAASGVGWGTSTDGGASFAYTVGADPVGFAPEFVSLPDGRLRLLYNSKVQGAPVDALISSDGGESWSWEAEAVTPCLAEALSLVPLADGGYRAYYHYWMHGLSGTDFGDAPDTAVSDPCDEVEDPRG